MKKSLLFIAAMMLLVPFSMAKSLQAHLSYATFFSTENGSYIETYLSINPNSVKYAETDDGMFKAALEITMKFKEEDKIVAFDKYILHSPKVADTANLDEHLLEQKRFALPSGEYNFEISIADANSSNKPFKASEKIQVDYSPDRIAFSDMQMVDSYKSTEKESILTKSGYDLVPYPSNFYPENKKEIIFYNELYNTSKVLGDDGKFLLKYYLQPVYTGQPMEEYLRIRRMDSRKVHSLFHKFDIEDLPSGNYELVMEVFNRENELIASKSTFFQRSNPSVKIDVTDLASEDIDETFASQYEEEEQLKEYIRALKPIANNNEKLFIQNNLNQQDLETLQAFLYQFWVQRDQLNTEKSWNAYKEKIKTVNEEFKTMVKPGYETDRGQVFLKYGPPNAVSQSYNEPKAYPYEIWQYYETERHRDSKFVFYAHDMVANDFHLIHSNVPGEVKNRKWQLMVYGRNVDKDNVDTEDYPDIWGSKQEYYDNPY
ncbi:MAG: GWxTD domain-containing protein [Bacteroidota bacterium]